MQMDQANCDSRKQPSCFSVFNFSFPALKRKQKKRRKCLQLNHCIGKTNTAKVADLYNFASDHFFVYRFYELSHEVCYFSCKTTDCRLELTPLWTSVWFGWAAEAGASLW